jgi:hypothetical protein
MCLQFHGLTRSGQDQKASKLSIGSVVALSASEQVIFGGIVIALFRAVVVTYTTAENDHLVGHHLGSEVSLAIVILPTPSLEPPLNVDLLASAEMLIAYLGEVPPGNYVEPLCLLASLTIR